MIVIANKNKKNDKFLPMLSMVDQVKLKRSCKKQLMEEIINNPESLKAYKEIEVYKIAHVNEDMELTECKKELLFTYEDLLNEIVEQLTKEKKENAIK